MSGIKIPDNLELCNKNFSSNLNILQKVGFDTLQFQSLKKRIDFKFQDDTLSVFHDNIIFLGDVLESLYSSYATQIDETESCRVERYVADNNPCDVGILLSNIIDSEDYVFLEQALPLGEAAKEFQQLPHRLRSCLFVGSLSLLYLTHVFKYLEAPISFALVEDDPIQFCILLHLCDLENIIRTSKEHNSKFHIVYQPNSKQLRIELLNKLFDDSPLCFQGMRVLRSPILSPQLIEVSSWLHSEDGLVDFVKGCLGNDTDEINQFTNAIWSTLSSPNSRLITSNLLPSDCPVLLVASGPSLDDQLCWLKEHHHNFTIVTAGSSIGTLLRNGIHVDISVLLEMATTVFRDMTDLVYEGYDLSQIQLISSVSVDPRITAYFDQNLVFHRPLATAYALFASESSAALPQAGPQAVNAAIEAMIFLGTRKFLLLGCDFGAVDPTNPRSADAIGTANRHLNQPVKGSYGRTIFSSHEQSVTRQLFENIMKCYQIDATSLGEGSYVDGVKVCKEFDIDEIIREFSGEYNKDYVYNNSIIRKITKGQVSTMLADAISSVGKLQDEISLVFESSKAAEFSNEIAHALEKHVSWKDNELSSSDRVAHRLSRFILFFLIQPLYHSTAENYKLILPQVLSSLSQLGQVQLALLHFLKDAADSTSIPMYDTAWIKSRVQKYSQ